MIRMSHTLTYTHTTFFYFSAAVHNPSAIDWDPKNTHAEYEIYVDSSKHILFVKKEMQTTEKSFSHLLFFCYLCVLK